MSGPGFDPHAGEAAAGRGAKGEEAPDRVESGPPGTRFTEIRRFARLDSTNRYLLDVARRRPQPNLVAVAEHQSAGRGRLGRTWEAPPGANLLVSMLLLPSTPIEQLHLCSAAVSLAAADACHLVDVEASLKWPNDLVVGERKLAGVLSETVPTEWTVAGENGAGAAAAAPRAVVVGVGVNVLWPPGDDDPAWASVPSELRGSATSVVREARRSVSPDVLLGHMLLALDARVGALDDASGRLSLAQEYRARCATIGRRVRVVRTDDEVVGYALDITPEGHLLVDVGACITTVTAGDVVHVRGAG
jgi:BirA family biotin operon repressor/biotin-[acetyl-CoA-carboxylase] ligase